MAASFAFLKDVRPYKTAWRVQVKMLHSWRHYTQKTGETLEMVLSDELGKKIHASVRKDLVNLYVNRLHIDDWVFIENFGLNYATGQYRPTSHLYKMAFIPGTVVMHCDPKSDSSFLSLAKYQKIQSGELNPHMLVDVIGQIITIGELENLEANNKPTCKIDFEIRDEK
ncbi:hypothetical protein CARUB_v10016287mg [Capsella rubella]|uniref:Replication protein A 70 kDa DNA-binding subunit B/D first OB fold domain-containing protein n=1 Tax=Capsella rubella TaxID=81985 RepID=R0GB75_9BRAS|nr:hypothetical protein CARUB_v10016287mg [Capsella rubella]